MRETSAADRLYEHKVFTRRDLDINSFDQWASSWAGTGEKILQKQKRDRMDQETFNISIRKSSRWWA